MHWIRHGLIGLMTWAIAPFSASAAGHGEPLVLHMRVRVPAAEGDSTFAVEERVVEWSPRQTALIICDMWDQHWCAGAARRVRELAPVMNQAVAAAREKGVLIIHAPSSCMDAYQGHPARRRAQSAPRAAHLPAGIGQWCRSIPAEETAVYPIDQSDGGCDDGPPCDQGSPWRSQIAAIEIRDEDAVSDSGEEIWNLLESQGISQVLMMGVHTNMCVLGRPFGLRNLARYGKSVVLVRDLTDTMYNSRCWPYVSHHEGTNRIVEHIEKYVCPTILSTDLTGKTAFAFAPEHRPRAVFLVGDDEYETARTLPAFARSELEPRGLRCTFVIADPAVPHEFPGAEALADADLMVVSVRRRAPADAQMAAIRRYVASTRPVVGIRTASHAFDVRGRAPAGHAEWPGFDPEVLGGHYTGHHANGLHPTITLAAGALGHPILTGVEVPFLSLGSLYKCGPLAAWTQPLLMGAVPGHPAEPVAWVHEAKGARVFYTSLGHPGDFDNASFRRLLRNGVFWALGRDPAGGNAPSSRERFSDS
jgi:nicotinamidase-related amidase